MAHIIKLPDEWNTPALLARLDSTPDDAIILVVPPSSRAMANPARARVLRRYAARKKRRLAIVSADPITAQVVADEGLPVYASVEQATQIAELPAPAGDGVPRDGQMDERRRRLVTLARQESARRRQRIREAAPRPASPWARAAGLLVLLAGLLSLIVLVAALIVPYAEIRLRPTRQPVAVTIDVTAMPGVDFASADQRLVPARRVEARIDGAGSLPTTGRKDAPDQRATGTVTFINRQIAPVEIPMGTIVRTSTGTNVRFRTTVTATVSGGIGASVSVPIEAVDPGLAGNVRSGTITLVDGPLATAVQVINEQPTSGGSVRQVSVVTNADKDRLRQAVLQQSQQTAYQRLQELLNEGEFLPPESVSLIVLSETFDHFAEEPAETLGLRLRILARGLAVDERSAQEIALKAMQDQLPERSALLADTIRYQRGPVTVQADRVSFSLTATAEAVSDIDRATIRAALAGLTLDEAQRLLAREWPLAAPPELRVTPNWLGRIPWIPWRIRVEVEWTE